MVVSKWSLFFLTVVIWYHHMGDYYHGDFPYSEVANRNVLAHVILGSRLNQPLDCPNEL